MELKADTLIMERPKCEIKGCTDMGLIVIGKKVLCGKHFVKLEEKKQQQLNEMIDTL